MASPRREPANASASRLSVRAALMMFKTQRTSSSAATLSEARLPLRQASAAFMAAARRPKSFASKDVGAAETEVSDNSRAKCSPADSSTVARSAVGDPGSALSASARALAQQAARSKARYRCPDEASASKTAFATPLRNSARNAGRAKRLELESPSDSSTRRSSQVFIVASTSATAGPPASVPRADSKPPNSPASTVNLSINSSAESRDSSEPVRFAPTASAAKLRKLSFRFCRPSSLGESAGTRPAVRWAGPCSGEPNKPLLMV
mmetsp:Transcript_41496/g.133946  ORF Transcript_41496/g.133946 Transcript_41496/m.133946 type:complete len:265 (+) Transcript_41496:1553-2347(+)